MLTIVPRQGPTGLCVTTVPTMDDLPDEAHQFDFWIGRWDVFGPAGRQVGTNVIEPCAAGECCVRAGRASATSRHQLNSWDPYRRRWHQTWMDSTGTTLLLTAAAGRRDGPRGRGPERGGPDTRQRHRISWTPSADAAEVRQYWQVPTTAASLVCRLRRPLPSRRLKISGRAGGCRGRGSGRTSA